MGKIRFFCDCGKEIWTDLNPTSLVGLLKISDILRNPDMIMCSDCIESETKTNLGDK